MNIPVTIYRYLSRHVLMGILIAFAGMLFIAFILDLLELVRKISNREGLSFAIALELALLKLPNLALKISPFPVLLGGMFTLTKLTRTHELVVARASGISVWQFLAPGVLVALALGVFMVTVFNPVAAAMLSKYEQIEAKYLKGKSSMLAVSQSGLWLKEIEDNKGERTEKIIHALRISQKDMQLYEVIIFVLDSRGGLKERIDADTAVLDNGYWKLENALITSPSKPAERETQMSIKTSLTNNQIQDSFASPETLSFWELAGFINTLQKAGFSGISHRMHWHSMAAKPFMFCGMLLIAAAFALRLSRGKSLSFIMAGGITAGFLIYFLTDVIYAFGLSGTLPLVISAWAPAIITNMLGITALLHFEDG